MRISDCEGCEYLLRRAKNEGQCQNHPRCTYGRPKILTHVQRCPILVEEEMRSSKNYKIKEQLKRME